MEASKFSPRARPPFDRSSILLFCFLRPSSIPMLCFDVLGPGLTTHILKGREPWSIRNKTKDADTTLRASEPACAPPEYPKPDGVLSFDLLSSLALSGVKHEHDQPAHLRVKAGMEKVATEVRSASTFDLRAAYLPRRTMQRSPDLTFLRGTTHFTRNLYCMPYSYD